MALSPGSQFVPVSLVFYGPEVAVETFHLTLGDASGRITPQPASPNPTLVKGCQARFAIENCGAIRLCTPGFYREDRPSLVWDEGEGAIAYPTSVSERKDDPSDLASESPTEGDGDRLGPLRRAVRAVSATSLKITEGERRSLTYGDNCLIWCSSIKPRTKLEWNDWHQSLDVSYDHISTIRDPHLFARAVGAMALQQEGLRGNGATIRHPTTGEAAQYATLPVIYGSVIYTDRRREYIDEAVSELEFALRGLFTKTSEHRHQREFRFALLSSDALAQDTLTLQVSHDLRLALKRKSWPAATSGNGPAVSFKDCSPSPRILRCLSSSPPSPRHQGKAGAVLSAQVRSHLHLAGIEHKSLTKVRRKVQTIERVDYARVEQLILEEIGSPGDARVLKLTLDGGPGSVLTLHDLGGLSGSYRIGEMSGEAVVTAVFSEPIFSSREVLIDSPGFDGTTLIDAPPRRLILSVVTANPSATVEPHISDSEGRCVLISVTSEDGTSTSSLEVRLDRSLALSARRIHSHAAASWVVHLIRERA